MFRPVPSRLVSLRRVGTAVVSSAALTALLLGGTTPASAATTPVSATDSFNRTLASGWGAADVGGTWSPTGGANRVNGSSGNLDIKSGQGFSNSLTGFNARTTNLQIAFSLGALPVSGDVYTYITPRQIGTSEYRIKVKVSPDGAVRFDAVRVINGVETTLQSAAGGFQAKAGATMNVKVSLSGLDKTAMDAVIWPSGSPVPGNQISIADSTAGLQNSGTVALGGYVSSSATNAPLTIRYDNLTVSGTKETAEAAPSVPKAPAAAVVDQSRDSLQPGTYIPSESTAGVKSGIALKPYNTSGADLVITQDGTVLDGLEIWGDIKVRAANVTIKNSRLHGGTATPKANTGVIDANDSRVKNLVVQDSTITPQSPSYYRDGIVGHDYSSLRNHISRTNDGLGIFNRPGGPAAANVTAKGNYIHGLTFWSNDPAHKDGTHNDGIQVQGGENILISGNRVVGDLVAGNGSANPVRGLYATTGMLVQQNTAKLQNVIVEQNFIDSGLTSITVDHTAKKQSGINLTVRNNYFGKNQYSWDGAKYQIRIVDRAASAVNGLSSNKWSDTMTPLSEGKNRGIYFNK